MNDELKYVGCRMCETLQPKNTFHYTVDVCEKCMEKLCGLLYDFCEICGEELLNAVDGTGHDYRGHEATLDEFHSSKRRR